MLPNSSSNYSIDIL